MKKTFFWLLALVPALISTKAQALDGFYVGASVGHVALNGNASSLFSNALGVGLDLSFRTNPILDVALRGHYSSHAGGASGLSLLGMTLSADFLLGNFNDIEFFLGGGPGFYQFGGATTNSRFGLHAEALGDLAVGENLRLGLAWRYHGVFEPGLGQGSYWTIMMRVGLTFPIGS